MKNITQKGILFIAIAVFLVNSTNAFAYAPYVPWQQSVQPYSYGETYSGPSYAPNPAYQPVYSGYIQNENSVIPAQNNNQNTQKVVTTNNTTTNTVRTTTPARVVNNTTTVNRGNTITTPADERELPPVVTIDQRSNTNDLAALSLAGTGGFMPSSVWQWLFVILLILAVIILFRMLTKANHHESHIVNH